MEFPMPPQHLQTLFCDDIRHETSGKLTLVGVYSDALIVPELPATLPRLCLVARLIAPLAQPPRLVTLRVFKDDQLVQEVAARKEDLTDMLRAAAHYPAQTRSERVQIVQFLVEFSPFQLDRPGLLRVHAETDQGRLEGAPLQVSTTPGTGPVTLQ